MIYFTNILLARVSLFLAFLLIVIWLLRLSATLLAPSSLKDTLLRWNSILRKHHKTLGILFVVVGLIHGLLSSESVFSFNFGTYAFLLSVILGLNFVIGKALLKKSWMIHHRLLTILLVGVISIHIVSVGGFTPDMFAEFDQGSDTMMSFAEDVVESSSDPELEWTLKDGVYEGQADGFGPDLTVQVTVKSNRITDVTVLSHNEKGYRYYGYAMENVPTWIVESQTTEVDTVSGATFTSIGIKNAVRNALENALIAGELPTEIPLPTRRGRH